MCLQASRFCGLALLLVGRGQDPMFEVSSYLPMSSA